MSGGCLYSITSSARRSGGGKVRRWSAACPTILDVIGGLLADCGQIQKLLLDEWVFGRFGKSPILGRLVTQIITPIYMEPRPTTSHPIADSWTTANNDHSIKTLVERLETGNGGGARPAEEHSNYRHGRLLLRSRRQRPRRRAAQQRDEGAAPHHSISSSARTSSRGGMSRPRALAVLRLISSSNLVGR